MHYLVTITQYLPLCKVESITLLTLSLTMTTKRTLSYFQLFLLHLLAGVLALLLETVKVTLTWRQGQTMVALGEGFYCGVVFLVTGAVAGSQHRLTTDRKVKIF